MIIHSLWELGPSRFVVEWRHPLFHREDTLDPTRLKAVGGRPAKHSANDLLNLLGTDRLKTSQWSKGAKEEIGITNGSFFALLKQLHEAQKVQKSAIDGKWEQLQNYSKTLLGFGVLE